MALYVYRCVCTCGETVKEKDSELNRQISGSCHECGRSLQLRLHQLEESAAQDREQSEPTTSEVAKQVRN